jgi:hypothetical protein
MHEKQTNEFHHDSKTPLSSLKVTEPSLLTPRLISL